MRHARRSRKLKIPVLEVFAQEPVSPDPEKTEGVFLVQRPPQQALCRRPRKRSQTGALQPTGHHEAGLPGLQIVPIRSVSAAHGTALCVFLKLLGEKCQLFATEIK